MSHTLRSIIGLAASSAFIFALQFESNTNLGANWAANRENMKARIQLVHTEEDGVHQPAVDANVKALDDYSRTLDREREVYGL